MHWPHAPIVRLLIIICIRQAHTNSQQLLRHSKSPADAAYKALPEAQGLQEFPQTCRGSTEHPRLSPSSLSLLSSSAGDRLQLTFLQYCTCDKQVAISFYLISILREATHSGILITWDTPLTYQGHPGIKEHAQPFSFAT